MSANAQPDRVTLLIAEEVLRAIYGDDLKGCTVSLEQIAQVISNALQQREAQTRGLLDVYEKVIEALHVLSKPPDASKIADPNELRSLLTERLDAIHLLTTRTIETILPLKPKTTDDESA